jgi:hypothetical protein
MRQKLSAAGYFQKVADKPAFTDVVGGRAHAIAKVLRCPVQGALPGRVPTS